MSTNPDRTFLTDFDFLATAALAVAITGLAIGWFALPVDSGFEQARQVSAEDRFTLTADGRMMRHPLYEWGPGSVAVEIGSVAAPAGPAAQPDKLQHHRVITPGGSARAGAAGPPAAGRRRVRP